MSSPGPFNEELWFAIAEPSRRKLIEVLLLKGEATASRLADEVPFSRQAVSKHIAVLKRAGLVKERKTGKEVRFSLALLHERSYPWVRLFPLFSSTHWDVCCKVSARFALLLVFPSGLFLLRSRVRYLMKEVGGCSSRWLSQEHPLGNAFPCCGQGEVASCAS